MKRFLLVILAVMLLGVGLVQGTPLVSLTSPSDASYDTDGGITFNFNVTGNVSLYTCNLWTDDDGTWSNKATTSNVANDTANTDFTRNSISDGTVIWNVNCTDPIMDINSNLSVTNFSVIVDSVDPVITVNSPTSNSWDRDGVVLWNLTVVDANAAQCVLKTNMNITRSSSNRTIAVFDTNAYVSNYTNDTAFTFPVGGDNNTWDDNGTGSYIWNAVCNDSAGQTTTLGSNLTFLVDKTAPGDFWFLPALWRTDHNVLILNDSIVTDFTPQVGWNFTAEINFSRYRLRFYNTSDYTGAIIELNITTQGSATANITTNMSALTADLAHFILITAFDQAGNEKNMTLISYKYTTTSTGRGLFSGWNIHMNPGNSVNLSNLLLFTGATTLSYFNSTHDFTSHVSGGSNGAIAVPYGEAYFAFMGADGSNSDMIRNLSAGPLKFNITNTTVTNYNIACNRNSTTGFSFQKLDYTFNGNTTFVNNNSVTAFSYYNNSGGSTAKYIPFRYNWTFNNNTFMNYADCSWFLLNEDTEVDGFVEIDWQTIAVG